MSHATNETLDWVQDYYGRLLSSSKDLKTNACCAAGAPPSYLRAPLSVVHSDVLDRFYGCGFPIPHGVQGCQVLDLGCGTGRDVYILAQLVGESGRVTGLDMTPSQLEVAKRTESWHADRFGYAHPNTHFVHGYIEDLAAAGVPDRSVDVVVSNCVVNLSPCKDRVLDEVHRVLKPGGEFYLSDVVVDRRLPPEVAKDPILYAECLGGAMYDFDFEQLARTTGFRDPRVHSQAPITIQNEEIQRKVGPAQFRSVTYRLFKLEDLEPQCEDYGQTATYRGGIQGAESVFWLDDHHAFELGRPERVCGNTASMLRNTRFASHFTVEGTTEVHFGPFPCGPTLAAGVYAGRPVPTSSGGCC